jgi:hypothetical protein
VVFGVGAMRADGMGRGSCVECLVPGRCCVDSVVVESAQSLPRSAGCKCVQSYRTTASDVSRVESAEAVAVWQLPPAGCVVVGGMCSRRNSTAGRCWCVDKQGQHVPPAACQQCLGLPVDPMGTAPHARCHASPPAVGSFGAASWVPTVLQLCFLFSMWGAWCCCFSCSRLLASSGPQRRQAGALQQAGAPAVLCLPPEVTPCHAASALGGPEVIPCQRVLPWHVLYLHMLCGAAGGPWYGICGQRLGEPLRF